MSDILKVSRTTDFKKLGSRIAYDLEEGVSSLQIRAVGDTSIAIGVKALISARSFLAPKGKDISIVPFFDEFEDNGKRLSAISFRIGLLS